MSARVLLTLAVAAATLAAADPVAGAELGFSLPLYVDSQLAGGEPILLTDPVHHTIVYSSHEGTTHIYRPGLASQTTFTFLGGYRNQVNIWTSKDLGRSWQRTNFGGGFTSNPAENTGFSDPDLTQDEGGRIYNTGINLANDSLFSSPDGGLTWDRGTAQCHDGDRPWLAGARRDEVFMATNTAEEALSHQIFRSTDGGRTCSTTGVPDSGELPDGTSYTGNGKIYYDHGSDRLVEPITYQGDDGVVAVGVGTWKRGQAAFTPHKAASTSLYAHWPAIALDDAGTIYLVYDNDPRAAGTNAGCDGSRTPLANTISLVSSKDFGAHWSAPVTVARPSGHRAFWPWIAAGDAGKVNVVWYETDKVVDLACQNADISVRTATITGADGPSPVVHAADPIGRPISGNSNICQSGTTCVATGEDRRLGDFFTNAVDETGCVIIATGDTASKDPVSGGERPVSLPLFVRQNAGPALRGGGDCSGESANLGLPVSAATPPGKKAVPCFSRRRFRLTLRAPKRDRLTSVRVYVNGKLRKTLRGRVLRRKRPRIDLLGLPRGRFTVTIQARTKKGRKLRQVRRYRTCVKRRRAH